MSGRNINPRFMFRDPVDAVVGGVMAAFQVLVVFVFPAVVVFLIARSAKAAIITSAEAAIITFAVAYGVWLLFTVWRLHLDAEGITFVRRLGWPKHVPWADVVSVEEVGRGELVRRGWLWPLFPAREMTVSLSSRGHFRIRTRTGVAYFPPDDAEAFARLVTEYSAGALARPPNNEMKLTRSGG